MVRRSQVIIIIFNNLIFHFVAHFFFWTPKGNRVDFFHFGRNALLDGLDARRDSFHSNAENKYILLTKKKKRNETKRISLYYSPSINSPLHACLCLNVSVSVVGRAQFILIFFFQKYFTRTIQVHIVINAELKTSKHNHI